MSQRDIIKALEAKVEETSGVVPIAWPNVPFKPEGGIYKRVNTLFAETKHLEAGSYQHFESGYMQVDVCGPLGEGDGPCRVVAEAMRDVFRRGLTLVQGGITVTIGKTPTIGSGSEDGGTWVVPCKIEFYSYF